MHTHTHTHTWEERPADHAREHHEEHGQQLEVAADDAAGLHVGQTASRQAPLDNHLRTQGQTPPTAISAP